MVNLKKLAICVIIALFISNISCTDKIVFSSTSSSTDDMFDDDSINYGSYIYLLAKASKLDLPMVPVSSTSTIFKDVRSSDIYAKALLDAQFLGFIETTKNKSIYPKKDVSYSEARRLALSYLRYFYKKADLAKYGSMIDKSVKSEFKALPKYINLAQGKFICSYLRDLLAQVSKIKDNNKVINQVWTVNVKSSIILAEKDKIIVSVYSLRGDRIQILGGSYNNKQILISYRIGSAASKQKSTIEFDVSQFKGIKNIKKEISIYLLEQR